MARDRGAGAPPQIVTLEGERQRTIALLSQHFAQDNLTIDELERRIESAYHATSVPGLQELTRDLVVGGVPAPARAVAADPYPPGRDRIVSVMSETKRSGVWHPARQLDAWCVMSDTTLDLTRAVLPPGVTEIRLRALMASVKVIVAPGVRVVLQPGTIMATVSDETMDPPAVGSGAPVVRITGGVMMAELRAIVRRPGLEAGDELDDE